MTEGEVLPQRRALELAQQALGVDCATPRAPTDQQQLRRVVPEPALREDEQEARDRTTQLGRLEEGQGKELRQDPARRQPRSRLLVELHVVEGSDTRSEQLAELERDHVIALRRVREKAAPILADQSNPRIVHPSAARAAATEVFPHDIEDGGLDLDAVEALQRVVQEATGGLTRTDADDQNAARVVVEQHREMRGQTLVVRRALALPPAVDLEAQHSLAPDHREVSPVALVHGDQLVPRIEEVIVGK